MTHGAKSLNQEQIDVDRGMRLSALHGPIEKDGKMM